MTEVKTAYRENHTNSMVNHLTYEGKLSGIYRYCFFHIVMSVLTLGIYYIIWGHYKIKSYLVSQVSLSGTKIQPNYDDNEIFKTALLGTILSIMLFLFIILFGNYIADKRFNKHTGGVYNSVRLMAYPISKLGDQEIGLRPSGNNKLVFKVEEKKEAVEITMKNLNDDIGISQDLYNKILQAFKNDNRAHYQSSYLSKQEKKEILDYALSNGYSHSKYTSFFTYLSSSSLRIILKHTLFTIIYAPIYIGFMSMFVGGLTLLLFAPALVACYSVAFYYIFQLLLIPYWLISYKKTYAWGELRISYTKEGAWKYCLLSILSVLSVFSLEILSPFIDVKRNLYLWKNLHIEDKDITVKTKSISLFFVNIISLLLFIPTLGISRFWYWAALDRHVYDSISFNDLRIKSIATGGKIMKSYLKNIIIALFGIGIVLIISYVMNMLSDNYIFENILMILLSLSVIVPIIMHRNLEFYINHHLILGDLNQLVKN